MMISCNTAENLSQLIPLMVIPFFLPNQLFICADSGSQVLALSTRVMQQLPSRTSMMI